VFDSLDKHPVIMWQCQPFYVQIGTLSSTVILDGIEVSWAATFRKLSLKPVKILFLFVYVILTLNHERRWRVCFFHNLRRSGLRHELIFTGWALLILVLQLQLGNLAEHQLESHRQRRADHLDPDDTWVTQPSAIDGNDGSLIDSDAQKQSGHLLFWKYHCWVLPE